MAGTAGMAGMAEQCESAAQQQAYGAAELEMRLNNLRRSDFELSKAPQRALLYFLHSCLQLCVKRQASSVKRHLLIKIRIQRLPR
jgi:hypothetical protein